MDTQTQQLFDEALKLPAVAREDFAVRLLGSVEPTESEIAEIRQAWIKEIDRRVAKLETGESAPIAVEEAWPKITGRAWNSSGNE